jgi:hypothetical protein
LIGFGSVGGWTPVFGLLDILKRGKFENLYKSTTYGVQSVAILPDPRQTDDIFFQKLEIVFPKIGNTLHNIGV